MANDNNKVIKELLEIIKHKIDMIEMTQSTESSQVRRMREQQSVMNEKLDNLQTGVKGIKSDIKELDKKADIIMEFASNVDEDLQENKKILGRIGRIPVIADVLNQ